MSSSSAPSSALDQIVLCKNCDYAYASNLGWLIRLKCSAHRRNHHRHFTYIEKLKPDHNIVLHEEYSIIDDDEDEDLDR